MLLFSFIFLLSYVNSKAYFLRQNVKQVEDPLFSLFNRGFYESRFSGSKYKNSCTNSSCTINVFTESLLLLVPDGNYNINTTVPFNVNIFVNSIFTNLTGKNSLSLETGSNGNIIQSFVLPGTNIIIDFVETSVNLIFPVKENIISANYKFEALDMPVYDTGKIDPNVLFLYASYLLDSCPMSFNGPCRESVRNSVSAIVPYLQENEKKILERRLIIPSRAFDSLSHVTFADISELKKVADASRESLMALFEINRTNSMDHASQRDAIESLDKLVSDQNEKLSNRYKSHASNIQHELSKFAKQAFDALKSFQDFQNDVNTIINNANKLQDDIKKISAEIEAKEKRKAACSMALGIFGALFSIFTFNIGGLAASTGRCLNSGADLSDINKGKYTPVQIPMRTSQIAAFIQLVNSDVEGLELTETKIAFNASFNGLKSRDKYEHLKYTADDIFRQVRDLVNYKLSFDNNEELKEKVNELHSLGKELLHTFELQVNSKIAFVTALFSAYDMQVRYKSTNDISAINENFTKTFLEGSMDEVIQPANLKDVLESNRVHFRQLIKDFWSALEYQEVTSISFEMPDENASILELSGSLDNLYSIMEQMKSTLGYSAFDVRYKRSVIICENKLGHPDCDIEDKSFFSDLRLYGDATWNYYLDTFKNSCGRERMHSLSISMRDLNQNADEQTEVFIKSDEQEVYLSPFSKDIMIVNLDSLELTQKIHPLTGHKAYANQVRARMVGSDLAEPDWSQEFCIAGSSVCPSPYKKWNVKVNNNSIAVFQNVSQVIFHFDLRGRCDLLTASLRPTILKSDNLSSEYYSVFIHSSNTNHFLAGTAVTISIYIAIGAFSAVIFVLNRRLTISWKS